MRILHLLPTDQFGGAEKVVLQLAKYDKDNEIIVACGNNVSKIFINNGISAVSININNKFETIKKIRRLVIENNIEIIHAHDNTISLIAYVSKKVFNLNVKIVSHIHNNYPWLQSNNIYKLVDRIFRNKYDINIYCGKVVEDYYLQYGTYIKREKTRVSSNSIEIIDNIRYFNKEELELENRYVYGFIGRITEQKGLKPFIKAFNKVKERFNDSIFIIIGDGDRGEEIRQLVNELNLETYFKFYGFQENVYKYFKSIDTVFLPSLYEGLPMIILEAMANEKTIVSMNVGSIGEVIKHNETGILVDKGNYNKFLEELTSIKMNNELRNKIGKNSYEYIKNNYDISKQIKEINDIYNELVNINRGGI